MVKRSASFSRLHDLLQQVSNEETLLALDIARRRSACLSVDAYPPHLARIISNVPNDAVSLFTALLSLRALQIQMVVGSKRSKAAHTVKVGSWTRCAPPCCGKEAIEEPKKLATPRS